MSNEILPFCATDTGSNLLTEAEYTAATDRTSGNKPGVASAKLNNKALRQATYVASQLAQFLANFTGLNVLDDATPQKLLALMNASLYPLPPTLRTYLSGTGTHNATYAFMIATGSATIGATYTNNAATFTVAATVASGVILKATGSGAPATSGTLTKSGGTGDATITFYAVQAPSYIRVRLVGGGGGGGGSNASGVNGSPGNPSYFRVGASPDLLVGGGGAGGFGGAGGGFGVAGGTGSLGTGPVGVTAPGNGSGAGLNSFGNAAYALGGTGGGSALFGGGAQGNPTAAGLNGVANSGGGGGGAGQATGSIIGGGGGSGGGGVDAIIYSPVASYAWGVGTGGVGGGGAGGNSGGSGGSGMIEVTEYYQ